MPAEIGDPEKDASPSDANREAEGDSALATQSDSQDPTAAPDNRSPRPSDMQQPTALENNQEPAQEVDRHDIFTRICDERGLSKRERDVFELLARGYTSPRIQKELYIAAGTVNYHSRNIYAKLGVHSKQELISLVESTTAERAR